LCQTEIEALHECHTTKSFGKYFGACNGIRAEMDKCLMKEHEIRSWLNRQDRKSKRPVTSEEIVHEHERRRRAGKE
jgi:COX assembly protein 2